MPPVPSSPSDPSAAAGTELVTAPAQYVPSSQVRTLGELHGLFYYLESKENPDAILPLSELKVDERGLLAIPGHGDFALTRWAQRQLAERLGIDKDRSFPFLGAAERRAEINRRISRRSEDVRIRTATFHDRQRGVDVPALRAFVSPSASPISDALLAQMLSKGLGGWAGRVSQLAITDMTVSYTVAVGSPFRSEADRQAGEFQGGILIRNSGVGYAGLHVGAYLTDLSSGAGMLLPVRDPTIYACTHPDIGVSRISAKLSKATRSIDDAFRRGADRLLQGRRCMIKDRTAAFFELLVRARLGDDRLDAFEAAYERQPEPCAYGIVQAATRASQLLAPEKRYDLERAAAGYLVDLDLGD